MNERRSLGLKADTIREKQNLKMELLSFSKELPVDQHRRVERPFQRPESMADVQDPGIQSVGDNWGFLVRHREGLS